MIKVSNKLSINPDYVISLEKFERGTTEKYGFVTTTKAVHVLSRAEYNTLYEYLGVDSPKQQPQYTDTPDEIHL